MADFDINSAFIPALHKPAALLPIAKHREALLYLIETKQVTIVVGHTGSGKTTQIPQFLEAAGWCSDGKVIGVTQVIRVLTQCLLRPFQLHEALLTFYNSPAE